MKPKSKDRSSRHAVIVGAVAAIVALTAIPASALDHLIPEDSALARLIPKPYRFEYQDYMASLGPVLDPSVRVFLIQEGTPFPESVIGLKSSDDGLYIFGAQPSRQTSPPEPSNSFPLKLLGTDGKYHKDSGPARPMASDYHLNVCRAPIDPKLADRIVKVWDKVLLETRPDAGKPMGVADGVIEHFGSNMQYVVVTGFALDINQSSRPHALSLIGYDLSTICWKWKQPVEDTLEPGTELERSVKFLESH